MLTLVSYKFLKGQRGFGALAHVKGESFPGFPGERGCAQRGEAPKVKLKRRCFYRKCAAPLDSWRLLKDYLAHKINESTRS